MVFLCIAQSDFILFVDYSLYHTTNGDVLQHRKKKRWAASVSDYRCCPLKLCFYPLSDRMKESNFLILFVGCALLRLFKTLAGRVHIGFHFPKLLRILLFQSGIRNFRNEKSCTRRFMIFILNSHALSQCATIYERLWRMGIYMHQHRLPRKGRGAGICLKYYCECGAFTVIFPSSRMKVSMKMRIFFLFFELHSWD